MRNYQWIPVFQNQEEILKVKKTIDKIKELLSNQQDTEDTGIFGSALGTYVFLAFYDRVWPGTFDTNLLTQLLRSSVQNTANKSKDFSFGEGLTGVVWMISLLNSNRTKTHCAQSNGENLRQAVNWIRNAYITSLEGDNFDFVFGSSGLLYSLLYLDDNSSHRTSAYKFINHFERLHGANPKKWLKNNAPNKITDNLSLAHGIPSLISILSRDDFGHDSRIFDFVEKAVDYLALCKNTANEISVFPSRLSLTNRNSRLAWCYGDLGIGYSILVAGNYWGRLDWSRYGLDICRKTTSRYDGVNEINLCHGSGGVAHIYNRLYNSTKEETFLDSSRYWTNQVLYSLSTSSVTYRDMDPKTGLLTDITSYGILEGLSGVGLALIASVTDVEPEWDKCILLS